MSVKTFVSRSEEETAAVGAEIARELPPDGIVLVTGDLGAGKTSLIRAIAATLGADPLEVASPTFAIVHEYPVEGKPAIIHIDGYRLSSHPREWMEIGIDELLGAPGLKFIEWPKREFGRFGTKVAEIRLRVEPDESRTIELAGEG
ncbi:MAG TPA: tRNA (adenosine(37)-N6)-threonylcarbamoyltransferase complex ATPase subunit type 1 TsaE [Thermoanaerobaculia bacterium]|nr:tRNA (adenosine(37)-N6)-threonylcarbamoyltransferase complex ATPase subunit type 1 TsaE [Thermoanaerobaculia bacterium]